MRCLMLLSLLLSACVTSKSEFAVVLNQYEAPIGWLSGYRGADAYALIRREIGEYCDGPFRELRLTASDDGSEHGITFECGSEERHL